MTETETTTPTIACDQCTGVMRYRVRVTHPNGLPDDNFDQLVDHPTVFARPELLRAFCEGKGSITVWRLGTPNWAPMNDRLRAAEVIAYAGPNPLDGGRTWWCETNPEGDADRQAVTL